MAAVNAVVAQMPVVEPPPIPADAVGAPPPAAADDAEAAAEPVPVVPPSPPPPPKKKIKMLQDTNKRLQEYKTSLQQYNSNLQADATKDAETIAELQKEKNTMVETMNGTKMQLDSATSLLEVEGLRMELQHVREDHAEIRTIKEMTWKTAMESDGAMTKTTALEETCSSPRETIKMLEIKVAAAKEKLKKSKLAFSETMTKYENRKKMLESLQSRIEKAEQELLDVEKKRKTLHNRLLELKGNIRVFCRVRPLMPNESGAVSYPKSGETIRQGIELMHDAQAYSFTFDKVFDESASQEHVFIEISELVQSALDGYKVCIFAYGQTGSGKTYTMMGDLELNDQKGMIPRSLEQIFRASEDLNKQGWKYKMQASMLEIYNETIRDLLAVNRMDADNATSSQYTINRDSSVNDLTVVSVTSFSEVSYLLRWAAERRSLGRTHMNEESSRRHCVFTLEIFGVNKGKGEQVQGVLNLIDLAGSECLSKSGATGDRLKETQAIDKSLSSLGDVIHAIARKDKLVPFRKSKLTRLLQPFLGGDSKTLMFVNLSPDVSSTEESMCSLRFAAKVNSCKIGTPRRRTQMGSSQ